MSGLRAPPCNTPPKSSTSALDSSVLLDGESFQASTGSPGMGSESDVFCTLRFQLRCNTLKFKMEHALCLPAPGNRQVLHVTDECEQDLKAIPPANRRSTKRSTCGIIGVFHKNWSTRSSGKAVRNIRPDALYHTIDYSSDIPPFSMTQFRTGLGTRDPVQAPADPTEAWDPKS